MENSLLPISKKVDYLIPSVARKWELSYGGRDKFYLTDAERSAFLRAVYAGSDTVQVGDMTLTKFFKYMVPVKVPQPEPPMETITMSPAERKKSIDKLAEIRKNHPLFKK